MTSNFSAVARFVDRLVETGRVNGAGTAIAVEGSPVFDYLAGDASPGVGATGETLWPLASISKLYTASAIMSLIEEGRLALSTNATSILPEFRDGGREEITLRHLLTHTSGLSFAPANIAELLQGGATWQDLVAHGYTDPLLFPPGIGQSYSDTGYGIAGLMTATVAEMSFPELIRTRVLEPAGLAQTYVQIPAEEHARVARVAGATGEGTDWAIYSSLYGSQIGHPAYGVMATVSDVLRFLLLFDPHGAQTIHSAAGLRAMTTDQTGAHTGGNAAFPVSKWGAGFMLQDRNGEGGIASPESYGHQGGTGCVGWIDPVYGVTVAFVSNSHGNRGRDEWRDRVEEAVNVSLSAAARTR